MKYNQIQKQRKHHVCQNGKLLARRQFAQVPNTHEGWDFINDLKKYLIEEKTVVLRGRGKRTFHEGMWGQNTWNQDLPLENASEIAIYVRVKPRFKESRY